MVMFASEESKKCKTVRILKTPKTESSIRKVFLSKSVALVTYKLKGETSKRFKEIKVAHRLIWLRMCIRILLMRTECRIV